MTGGVCSAVQDSEDQYHSYIYLLTYQSDDPKSCTDRSVQSATVDQSDDQSDLQAVQDHQNHQELTRV